MRESVKIFLRKARALDLREEGHDGGTSMAANDRYIRVVHVPALVLRHKGLSARHVEGGDTKEPLGVVHALLL